MNNHARSFPIIAVSGTSYEMGYQLGSQAGELVHGYLRWIEKLTGKGRDVLLPGAMSFVPAIRELSPRYMEEVRGVADGAGISFEEAVLCQVRGEAARAGEGGCSAFALTGEATEDGQPLAGQNQDLEPDFADVSILLHVKPTDGRPAALMFTFAGQLGYSGMNRRGLAHFANALYDFTWRPGIPHYPLKRVVLEQESVEACVKLYREYDTCSAANLIMCDGRGSIADVEVRPGRTAVFDDDSPYWRVHTNHYVTPEFARHQGNGLADSGPRLDRMRQLIGEHWGSITVDTMKAILADHDGNPGAICRHGAARLHSISGYIAEPARGLLHVRRGYGCSGTWRAYNV